MSMRSHRGCRTTRLPLAALCALSLAAAPPLSAQQQQATMKKLADRAPARGYLAAHANVFGTPAVPRAFGGTPGIDGVPPMARGSDSGPYTKMKMKSPFGDAHGVMDGGTLDMTVMPTEYALAAFWGMGMVKKNGEVLDPPRLVHGMLTE